MKEGGAALDKDQQAKVQKGLALQQEIDALSAEVAAMDAEDEAAAVAEATR